MTGQIEDTVIWKKKKYDLLGYEGDEEFPLFTPNQYGMNPRPLHTACWRGFYCTYKIVRNSLYLDALCVGDADAHYPPINDVTPNLKGTVGYYADINLPIPYTGILRIGADFHQEQYIHMGFQKPSAYGIVWDLNCTGGKIIDSRDISDEVKKIEGQYHQSYQGFDVIKRIDDSFSRDLELR